jgi:hypothetical protein
VNYPLDAGTDVLSLDVLDFCSLIGRYFPKQVRADDKLRASFSRAIYVGVLSLSTLRFAVCSCLLLMSCLSLLALLLYLMRRMLRCRVRVQPLVWGRLPLRALSVFIF